MSDDFNWNDLEKNDLITPSVQAVACYRNPAGDVVIRQESALGEEDSWVVMSMDCAEKLANRLLEFVSEARDEKDNL